MKKFFLPIVLLFSIAGNAAAQATATKDYIISAGPEAAYAVGPYSDRHGFGYGVSAQADYYFYETAAVTLNMSYFVFATKSSIYTTPGGGSYEYKFPANTFLPVLLGLKLNLSDNYYFHPQMGVAFRNNGPMGGSFAFGLGMEKKHYDLSFRFEGIKKKAFSANFFALRAAYVF